MYAPVLLCHVILLHLSADHGSCPFREHFCEGPSLLGGPYTVKQGQQSRPLVEWSLPISLGSRARRVFFEVPNPSSFPALTRRPSPALVSGRRRGSIRPSPRLLGTLERSSYGDHFELVDGMSSESDDGAHNSWPLRSNYKTQSTRRKKSSGSSETKPTILKKRGTFSSLPSIDISSLATSSEGKVIKELVSMWDDALDDGHLGTFCLVNGGTVFQWTGTPGTPPKLVPTEPQRDITSFHIFIVFF